MTHILYNISKLFLPINKGPLYSRYFPIYLHRSKAFCIYFTIRVFSVEPPLHLFHIANSNMTFLEIVMSFTPFSNSFCYSFSLPYTFLMSTLSLLRPYV